MRYLELTVLFFFISLQGYCQKSRFVSLKGPVASDFTVTELAPYPFTSVDSRHGDLFISGGDTTFVAGGGVDSEPQVPNRDLVEYNFDTDTWDSICQMPFDCIECFWVRNPVNNKIYIIPCQKDSLFRYDGACTFTLVATGFTFMDNRCYFNFGAVDDGTFLIQGGNNGAGEAQFFDDVVRFDTLGNVIETMDTTFFRTGWGTGSMPEFQGKFSFFGGGNPTSDIYINPYHWSTSDTGTTWVNNGVAPIRLYWSDFELIDQDHAILCCGYSNTTLNVSTAFVADASFNWSSLVIAWDAVHAATMVNHRNKAWRFWGRVNDGTYSDQVWTVEYTP